LESNKAFISNYSYSDNCDRASSQLLKNFNDWFASDTFRPLREKFLAKLKPVDTIRIIVQTENIQLHSQGIDTERDRLLLERLPNSLTTLLVEPTRQELTEQL
jgi:hypothetical protein